MFAFIARFVGLKMDQMTSILWTIGTATLLAGGLLIGGCKTRSKKTAE